MKAPASGLRRLTDVIDALVDEKVGIVQRVEFVPRGPGDPDFFQYAARGCDTSAFARERNFANTGGASANRDAAMVKAVGEAVERYCSAIFDVESLPLCSARDAPFRCVPPADFALYSAAQHEEPGFPWLPFDDTTPIRWTPAIDPLTGVTWHVPAAMVYMPYIFYEGSGDTPFVQPISTGLACHMSPQEAAIGALCEVIERDAFTLAWQARKGLPQLRIETLDAANFDLVRRFVEVGFEVRVLDATTDIGVPAFMAVLLSSNPGQAALAVSAAADLDPVRALSKCLDELEHTRRFSQQIMSRMPRLLRDPGHGHVVDQISHLNFWCDHANLPLADFLFASETWSDFDSIENLASGDRAQDLRLIARRAAALGHRALLADLTTADVAGLGMSVVRGLIPGFHPLFMGYSIRASGGRRLREALRSAPENPNPHPFP